MALWFNRSEFPRPTYHSYCQHSAAKRHGRMGLEQTCYHKHRFPNHTDTYIYNEVQHKSRYTVYTASVSLFFFLINCLLIHSGGFSVGSRSATTSPTGSVHSTPTHQTKPNTLDPFADIGNLGGSLGGQTLEKFLNFLPFLPLPRMS